MEGQLSAKAAQRLRGRMQFAEAQIFGRTGRRCLKVLTEFAEGRKRNLQDKDSFFLRMFANLLEANSPREVTPLAVDNVVIFTDACYERESATWQCGLGGVLCFHGYVQYFSLELDTKTRSILGEQSKKQIIFEAETLAAVVAFSLWKDKIAGTRCLLFVDNEGTKFSLLKGFSDNSVVDTLARCFAELEATVHSYTWLSRVPSKSNIADPPSRNDISSKFFADACNRSACATTSLNWILEKLEEMGVTDLASSHLWKSRKRSCQT